jgi:GNAT superfamily N-acetyltransferase
MQAAEWAEYKWGYMCILPGINKRIDIIQGKKKYFYLAMHDDQDNNRHLVDTFSLTPNQVDKERGKNFIMHKKYFASQLPDHQTINLNYFYVHENYREFGFGSQMLDEAKTLSEEANMIVTAHLLTLNVHGFYAKRDATFVDEDRSLKEPCVLIYFKKNE